MSQNTRGRCPVASTPKNEVMVTLLNSKNELPKDAIKIPEYSNETWSHYISNGVSYGYKKKNYKKYF